MKTPKGLQALLDDGIVDGVLRQLKSGKEASVYIVASGSTVQCAKVYKDANRRGFHKLAEYQEGRRHRGSRESRAMGKRSRFGRDEQESAWKNAEVEALFRLFGVGVRVPRPYGVYDGVLLMELVTDAAGHPAPRLNDVILEPAQAREWHTFVVGQVVRMLCAGMIHGDLSEYNVLVAPAGPVLIDFPQVVSASGNNAAREMLLRDVHNLRDSLGRFAPELLTTHYGEEMWALYERGKLTPDSVLSGRFVFEKRRADVRAVMDSIEDARQVALIRQQGREAAEQD